MTEKHDTIFNFPFSAGFIASWSLDFGITFYKNFNFILNSFFVLQKNCMKITLIRMLFWFVFSHIAREHGKIRSRKKPYLDTFQAAKLKTELKIRKQNLHGVTLKISTV